MVSLWARQFVPTVQRRASEGQGKSTPVQEVKFRIGDFGAQPTWLIGEPRVRITNEHGHG